MTTKHVQAASSSSTCFSTTEKSDKALNSIIKVMEQDRSRIWNAVEIFDMYLQFGCVKLNRKSLTSTIQEYFGEDVAVLHSPGIANMLLFKFYAPNLIKLVSVQDDDDLDIAVISVAKHIVSAVKSINIDRDRYNTRIDSEMVSICVSNILSSLLSMIRSMITGILKKRPTAFKIAFGVLMRNPKKKTYQSDA
ncbi:hypothetical protein DPMN_063265 [Dreissena polymorpha]|uniref:Uncharacterized protein n=1 Tax=Dreissena polymorpha TaxID=45954 RepID=A0A9D4CA71_DREPO|nr:hypothetical protein DPMN_063265 [Dreissena polymorpha]